MTLGRSKWSRGGPPTPAPCLRAPVTGYGWEGVPLQTTPLSSLSTVALQMEKDALPSSSTCIYKGPELVHEEKSWRSLPPLEHLDFSNPMHSWKLSDLWSAVYFSIYAAHAVGQLPC